MVGELCLRVARRYARSPDEAEDMAQNAVIRAWRNHSKLKDTDRRREWVSSIARNEALRELQRRVPEPMEAPEILAAEDRELVSLLEGSSFTSALSLLSEEDRRLLQLRYEEDLTQSAIADRLEIPEGTVKVRLFRARAKLRETGIE